MQCPSCTAENPQDNQFCGKCGSNLNPGEQAINRCVEHILRERFKDKSLVEYDLSEKLTNRFSTYLKIAGWVFAPSLFILAIAMAMVAYLGFKTLSEAETTIRSAAEQVAKEVQGRAQAAENTIEASVQQAQKTIDSYGQSPALKASIEVLKQQTQKANSAVAAVVRSADENQQKLAQLSVAAISSPAITLGQLNPSLLSPSWPSGLDLRSADENQQKLAQLSVAAISSPATTLGQLNPSLLSPSWPSGLDFSKLSRPDLVIAPVSSHYFTSSSTGEDVSTLQRALLARGCYSGDITGHFTEDTAKALADYDHARWPFSPLTTYPPSSTYVSDDLWRELTSATITVRCK